MNNWDFNREFKRVPGGCATTLNVFECLGLEFDDTEEEEKPKKPFTDKFDRANFKLTEAQNLMEVYSHGLTVYDSI
jgi:hypothetical protein